jgi:lipopolysaccharide transport system ATP-binding protein
VRDVSFEVRRGECLGLIGHNGAGKSTLLKMLNSLNRPDAGRITMRGRVGALIELNAGFNPILTGRENIYNQAALLGFSKREVEAKFDAIVEFSELENYLDMPLQNYSSGMRVRLGFAVSAQLEPDIMLVDEVLAVGDIGFRYKCMNRISELQRTCAFILVSHSMPQIARVCTHVLHLDRGRTLLYSDSLKSGIDSYYGMFDVGAEQTTGSGKVQVISARAVGPTNGNQTPIKLKYGDSVELEIECEFDLSCKAATIQIVIWSQEMIPVVDVLSPGVKRFPIAPDDRGICRVRCRIDSIELNSGTFLASLICLSPDGGETYLRRDRAFVFQVSSNSGSACSITKEAQWETFGDERQAPS